MASDSWLPIPLDPFRDHYDLSDRGRARRTAPGASTRPGKILSIQPSPWGVSLASLHANGTTRHVSVVPLVAKAFLPPRPFPGAVLNHVDGDRGNCAATNLVWTTRAVRGARCGTPPKLSPAQVAEVLALRGSLSGSAVARRFGVGPRRSIGFGGESY
jgi:hypothetical protein